MPVSLLLPVTCLSVLPMADPILGISSSTFFAALFSPRPIPSRVHPWCDPAFLPEDSDAASTEGVSVWGPRSRKRTRISARKIALAF